MWGGGGFCGGAVCCVGRGFSVEGETGGCWGLRSRPSRGPPLFGVCSGPAATASLAGFTVEPVRGAAGTALEGDVSTLMRQLREQGAGGLAGDKKA